jgi:hypothetical protein
MISNSAFYPKNVFISFVWLSELPAIISLNSTDQMILVTKNCCVFSEVRIAFLNII